MRARVGIIRMRGGRNYRATKSGTTGHDIRKEAGGLEAHVRLPHATSGTRTLSGANGCACVGAHATSCRLLRVRERLGLRMRSSCSRAYERRQCRHLDAIKQMGDTASAGRDIGPDVSDEKLADSTGGRHTRLAAT